ncbi:hypothetical protein [Pedosphaera parvula]|uniref:Uncharacterized protein n=1 Tax=Pedosphaera parvula (strain Ellin514) TaxID=320771 RepID=B9XGY1_PEDPL|nr:hypothetical protein [Pedosphaera parvula]EEF60902.1 hypothetical protein Cflav_PD4071 [Pedosphaera parvula Ellin514]
MMKSLLKHSRVLVLAGSLLVGLLASTTVHGQTSLTADEIMQRAVKRSESNEVRDAKPNYAYTKHTVTEEMDSKGHVKEHREKIYQMLVESGWTSAKLVQLNGQSLSTEELKKQEEKEAAERQKYTDSRLNKKGDNRENFLTFDIIERFKFTLVEEKEFNGRPTYVIVFQPRSADLPVKKITDRFLNQVGGTLWVDKQEFELSKIDAHLQNEVALWGGMIGVLRKCNFVLERTRMPDGAWFSSASNGVFEGRKLLEPMKVLTKSESTNFRKLSLARD